MESADEELFKLPHMTKDLAALLVSHKIKTREDVADLAVDELVEISGIDEESAKEMIMTARAPWFE